MSASADLYSHNHTANDHNGVGQYVRDGDIQHGPNDVLELFTALVAVFGEGAEEHLNVEVLVGHEFVGPEEVQVDADEEHGEQQDDCACALQVAQRLEMLRVLDADETLDRHGDQQPPRQVEEEVENERVHFADALRVDHEFLGDVQVGHMDEPLIAAARV